MGSSKLLTGTGSKAERTRFTYCYRKGNQMGRNKKRFDILVYKDTKPWLIVECKEMNVPLSESVLEQVLHYNSKLETQYIVITNGNDTFGFDVRNAQPTVMNALPNFVID